MRARADQMHTEYYFRRQHTIMHWRTERNEMNMKLNECECEYGQQWYLWRDQCFFFEMYNILKIILECGIQFGQEIRKNAIKYHSHTLQNYKNTSLRYFSEL